MTPEEKRIEIAKACGWKFARRITNPQGESWDVYQRGDEVGRVFTGTLPDYLNDLNAMHEAEKMLNVDQASDFYWALKELQPIPGALPCDHWVYHCTAAQRAEAFIKTVAGSRGRSIAEASRLDGG